jgi:signal transduction histidine kinase
MGTVLSMIFSTILLLIIAANICRLADKFKDNGGIIAYTRNVLGHDHAFLTAWILIIAYLSIMWANATATILLIRFLCGDVLAWGYLYTIAGFDINLGEIIFTWTVFCIYGIFSCYGGSLRKHLNTFFAILFFGTVVMLFAALYTHTPAGVLYPQFQFKSSPFMQVFSMMMLAPWMFFGFEAITHTREHATYSNKKLLLIMIASVVAGGIIYVALAAMAVMAIPPEFSSWTTYIAQKNTLEGIKALPVFNSVYSTFGQEGLFILVLSIISAISTSLLGLFRIIGMILQYMSEYQILPQWFGKTKKDGTPRNAIIFIMLMSLLIPFLGRVSVVWLCDVITVVGSLAYGYASICSYIISKKEQNSFGKWLGGIGVVISVLFFFFPLVPGMLLAGSVDTESYLMLSCWSLLGFILFWYVFKKDKEHRFGQSTSMCIILLFLNFFSSSLWIRQSMEERIKNLRLDANAFSYSDFANESFVQMAMIMLILLLMADIFITLKRRERELTRVSQHQNEINQAKNIFLSNLSHDIRIPMETAQSSVHLALETCTICGVCPEENCPRRIPDRLMNSLSKIDSHSQRLLAFIDNMLDKNSFSAASNGRITGPDVTFSGIALNKFQPDFNTVDLINLLHNIKDLFALQMQDSGLFFDAYPMEVAHPIVLSDERRLERMLANLLSNAHEYTKSGGGVMLTLIETGTSRVQFCNKELLCGNYEFHVRDTSGQIPPVVLQSLTEEYDTEVMDIGGLYIVQGIVRLMQGTVEVGTIPEQDGKEIIIKLNLPIDTEENFVNAMGQTQRTSVSVD